MGQTIDTSYIAYVARLLRSSAPAMPKTQDNRLFLRDAQALENRAAMLTTGVPASADPRAPIDITT